MSDKSNFNMAYLTYKHKPTGTKNEQNLITQHVMTLVGLDCILYGQSGRGKTLKDEYNTH
jgi:hypothetical protein